MSDMNDVDLDNLRAEAIAKIQQAFPKERQTKGKAKLTRGGYPYESKILKEVVEGKSWQEIIEQPQIVYYLSEVDFMAAFSNRAYDYYFPAFLIASVNEPNAWIYYSVVLDYMWLLAQRSKTAKLEALIAWLEYQLEYLRIAYLGLEWLPDDKQVSAIKETLQKIHQLIDQKRSTS
jgi:hypothetical protein